MSRRRLSVPAWKAAKAEATAAMEQRINPDLSLNRASLWLAVHAAACEIFHAIVAQNPDRFGKPTTPSDRKRGKGRWRRKKESNGEQD